MTAAELIAEARRAHRMSASDESRPTLYGRLADALEHADRISRLHEEATENAARYSAVIAAIRDNLTGGWTREKSDRLDALLKADPSTVLRERDAATRDRVLNEVLEHLANANLFGFKPVWGSNDRDVEILSFGTFITDAIRALKEDA